MTIAYVCGGLLALALWLALWAWLASRDNPSW